jgi:tetratricopeptide (TPR) repeat protein
MSSAEGAVKRFAVALFVLLLAAAPARADEQSKSTARAAYERGVTQYNLGHFNAAIPEFEKAYELEPVPVLLYNIAQAHRQLGNNERAIFFYRRYVESAPKAGNRADVERRIHELEEVLRKQGEAKSKPPTQVEPIAGDLGGGHPGVTLPPASASATTATPSSQATTAPATAPAATAVTTTEQPPADSAGKGSHLRLAGVATAAVGGACLVTGVIFGAMASSKSDSVASAMQFNPSDDSAGGRAATLQWVFYGIGAAAVGTGAVLYYLGWRADAADSRVALLPTWGPGGAGATLRVGF